MTTLRKVLALLGIAFYHVHCVKQSELGPIPDAHGFLYCSGGFYGAHVDRQRGGLLQEARA